MGVDQSKTYGSVSKFTGLRMKAEDLCIVGIDCDAEERPELAESPRRLRAPIPAEFIRSLDEDGIQVPVLVKKFPNDPRVYVAGGRRRVMGAREVNEERKKARKEPLLVPCVIDKGDGVAAFVLENGFRVEPSVLEKAEHANRLIVQGHEEATVRRLFGVSKSTLTLWSALATAPPKVKRAVEREEITIAVAIEISKMPPPDQPAALEQAIESGRSGATLENVRAARKASRNGGAPSDAPRRLPLAGQKKFAETLALVGGGESAVLSVPIEVQAGHAVLRAVLGDASALDPFPALRHAFDVATAPKGAEVQADV